MQLLLKCVLKLACSVMQLHLKYIFTWVGYKLQLHFAGPRGAIGRAPDL